MTSPIALFLPRGSRRRVFVLGGICSAMMLGCAPESHYAGDGTGKTSAPSSNAPSESPRPLPSSDPSAEAPVATAPPELNTGEKQSARPEPQAARPPRSRALLVTELNGLEQLTAATPESAPDHAQLLRRLAEDYVELEASAHLAGQDADERNARTRAIAAYSRLISDHPEYAQLDEALFDLATQYEQAGDLTKARENDYLLIQKAPRSRFVPHAYLAFGEMFFDEGAKDPSKYELAASAYREVMKFPPSQSPVYGYAAYKLGWSLFDEGDTAQAAKAFEQVLDFVAKYPDASGAQKLGEAARSDLAALQSKQSQ